MIFFLILLLETYAKFISTTIVITSDEPWKYISKFAMIIGKGKFEVRAQFLSPILKSSEAIPFQTSIYIDKLWPDVLSTVSCTDKENTSGNTRQINLPTNGDWSNKVDGILTQNVKTHFWYLTFSKCDITTKHKIRLEIQFTNSDGSEFSAEDHGMQYVFPVILLIYFSFVFKNLLLLVTKFEKSEEIEPSTLVLSLAIFAQFSAIFFEVIHLWIYVYNGSGFLVFDVFHQSLQVISEIIITVMFILIASGWTLKYKSFPDADIYIPISMLVISINLVIIGLGRLADDSYHKYSDFEGISAFLLVAFRIASWGWFIYLVKDMDRSAGVKLMNFLFEFTILASGYLLSLPFVIVLSWVFEPYWQKIVISLLSNLIQVAVFIFLTHLFSNHSAYYQLSTMSESVLPGKSL